MSKLNLFLPIHKIDTVERLVYARATEEKPDSVNEIHDYSTSLPYWKAWNEEFAAATDGKSLGNVRAMHNPDRAVGLVKEIEYLDGEKAIDVCMKIVDDSDWEKLQEGVYTGVSVGGSYVKKWNDPENPVLKRYTAKPGEISLVDRPMYKGARFNLIKADGSVEQRMFSPPPATRDSQPRQEDGMKHLAATVLAMMKAHGEEDGLLLLGNVSSEDLEKMDGPGQKETIAWVKLERLGKKDFTEDDRKKLADEGKALPDGSFPIESEADLGNAVKAYGRAKDKEAAKKHIIARAKALKATDKLPADWEGSTKSSSKEQEAGSKKTEKSDASGDIHSRHSREGGNPGSLKKIDAANAAMAKCCGGYGSQIDWMATPEVFDVQKALAALSQVSALIEQEKNEDHPEAAEQLASLTEALLALKDFISSEIQEVHGLPGAGGAPTITMHRVDGAGNLQKLEIAIPADCAGAEQFNKLFDSLSAINPQPATGDSGASLAKSGARHSASDLEKIQAIHDHTASLGATCSTEKGDKGGDLEKAESKVPGLGSRVENDSQLANPQLATRLAKLDEALDRLEKSETANAVLEKRVKELEDGPGEGKALLKVHAISREQDTGAPGKTEGEAPTEAELAKLDALDRRLVEKGGFKIDDLKKMDLRQKAFELTKIAAAEQSQAE